jgi:DNA sulfur modification protein DndD
MIFTRLTVENFGVFRGKHNFQLNPSQTPTELLAPVVLYGGKNGSGKTTLLEAVRLCLYGRAALGNRVRRIDYEAYLRERVHRTRNGDLFHTATVEIGFEYVHAGVLSKYDAVRRWHVEGEKVEEHIYVHKDGHLFNDIDDSHWDEFLRDLIPPGVADLFFFDGEQIQSLADEETETAALETAIGGLLNLNLIERLRTDLDLYLRQQEQKEQTQLQRLADSLRTEFESLDQILRELKQDRAGLVSRLDQLRKRADVARQALVREGANFLEQRAKLEERRKDIEQQLEQTRNLIREQANALLPFAIAPRWTWRLRSTLQLEAQAEEARLAAKVRKESAETIAQALLNESFRKRILPKATASEWTRLAGELTNLLQTEQMISDEPNLHAFSNQRREQILSSIQEVLEVVPNHIEELGRHLEQLEEEQSRVAQALRQIPEDAVANPLIEEFQRLSEQIGEVTQQKNDKDEAIRQLELQIGDIERQRKKVWLQIASAVGVDLKMERAAKVQITLDQYRTRITEIKLRELEEHVADYFNRLCRKQEMVRYVSIDPDNYHVTLRAENGEVIPKSSLSAGERQLYAMALLWALRSVSGRQLPVIVDTPMARLDSDHRLTLLTEFFPHAAHQLILLSTDTEIDSQAYDILRPAISHAYLLNYDMDAGCTTVEERYFVDSEQVS